MSTAAHAADCPGLSDKNVSITGEVIEHMKGAGMLKIKTKTCGKLSVGIPAKNKSELEGYLKECSLGTLAMVKGDTVIGILEAKVLACM